MKDIAADLGVSVVTVSKALRHHPDIAKATRERVLKRVEELHYRPNLMARSLVTGRSSLIGMVVPDLIHPFFTEIGRGLSLALRDAGYFLIVASSDGDPEVERQQIDHLMAHKLDAMVVASAQDKPDFFRDLMAQGTPLVLVDRLYPAFPCNFVGGDDHKVGVLATEHLISIGRKRIAHIRGPENSVGKARCESFCATLKKHGISVADEYVVAPEYNETNGRATGNAAMKTLLSLKQRPDAVFCFNDNYAIGAMDAIYEAGLKIPKDIALVGCGNYYYDDILRVPLSSVDQSMKEMGRKVAKIVLGSLGADGPSKPKRVLLEPKLVVRASTQG